MVLIVFLLLYDPTRARGDAVLPAGSHRPDGPAYPYKHHPRAEVSALGGCIPTSPWPAWSSILNLATLTVFLQAKELFSSQTAPAAGEYYFLTLVTLLGMYFMVSVAISCCFSSG